MALNQLKDTERKLQQLETAAKADQRNETFRQISTSLEANWLHVKTQIDNRVRNFTEPLTGIKRLLAKSSCYQMGDLFGDGEADERPLHEVCVDDIYLGKFEVIQASGKQ